jgi:AAA+ ATPase superfamily predicted ATPase
MRMGEARTTFVGRARELAVLEAAYASPRGAFVPIYGRRRIGKSELLRHFLGSHRGLYHVGKVAPAGLQRRELLEEAARVLGEPLLAELPADDWRSVLVRIEERWKGPGKLVLALDEFQWTVEASPELPSLLQELWDTRWKSSGKVMLCLCGSFIGFMEREVLGEKSPLFGRRTAQIHLKPFGYGEAAAFHPSWSLVHRAQAYFVCGGVPQYLLAFEPHRSFEANVQATILSEFAPLAREPEFLLREELRDVGSYQAVLFAMARGRRLVKDIAKDAGVPERSLHYYLEQLVSLGFVSRRLPLTGEKVPARNVAFVLEDPLLRFWFRFVFPHGSFVQRHGPRQAWSVLVKPGLEAYFGGCFERLCREALPLVLEQEGVETTVETGEWWGPTAQIDVVGLRGDGWVELGECKWGAVKSRPALEAELRAKIDAFPGPRNATLVERYFVRDLPAGKKVPRWHSLAELYKAAGVRGPR